MATKATQQLIRGLTVGCREAKDKATRFYLDYTCLKSIFKDIEAGNARIIESRAYGMLDAFSIPSKQKGLFKVTHQCKTDWYVIYCNKFGDIKVTIDSFYRDKLHTLYTVDFGKGASNK
ncbi:hypothetical protein X848_gp33 [Edwardsiella phage PEi21]|uniref:Uncharacterized protein n=1 Tax=Edwardsiella phage PEi21 TaxID=1325372 RepID=N0DSD1_9CAUD|nr:hypothetical protein X848_gp33 [Edwardsiella phage PEi21]BAN16843.1 hypothetical protein [Edwardsiella phage PEi21]